MELFVSILVILYEYVTINLIYFLMMLKQLLIFKQKVLDYYRQLFETRS